MIVVANMADYQPCSKGPSCPNGYKLYNTQVAFDNRGNLLNKYHKYNLFLLETNKFDTPPLELSYFDTEFGRFGTKSN